MWPTMTGGKVIEVDNFTVFTVQNFKFKKKKKFTYKPTCEVGSV
jgi:hypothetical protein